MQRRLAHPLALALGTGLLLQMALAFAPDPGVGPASAGLSDLPENLAGILHVFTSNLETLAILTGGALAMAGAVLSGRGAHPRRRLIAYFALLAAAAFIWFVTGVDWLAGSLRLPRADMALRLVHGYLEWPALLLPWAGVAFAVKPGTARRGRLDFGLVAASLACSVALLLAAATVEALVTPTLLAGPTA